MAYSTKLSNALHLLVFIATEQGADLSSGAIAKSLAANPSSVRQLMGRLRRAGIITSVIGHARPELANAQLAIGEYFDDVQQAAEDAMAGVSLAQIIERYRARCA